jgi:hypothetical protein
MSDLSDHDVERIARRVVEVLLETERRDSNGASFLTTAQVARRLSVSRGWVYEHADELGATRLANGPKGRLRFDPAKLPSRIEVSAEKSPAKEQSPSNRGRRVRTSTVELLPIRGHAA